METPFAPSSLSFLLYPFMYDFQSFNSDFVGSCIHAGSDPLGRPTFDKIPANFFFAVFAHQNDGAVLALGFSIDGFLAPLPERMVVGYPPLQDYVGVLGLTGQFEGAVSLLSAPAVIDRVRCSVQTRTLSKSVTANSVD